MHTKVIAIMTLGLVMANCSEKNEDVVQDVNKEGAVETEMTITHLDDQKDLIITKHKIWSKGVMAKEVIYKDTVPALGEYEEENEEGIMEKGKKEYEIYFTAK